MSYADKVKRIQEIKNRYKKGGTLNNREYEKIDESRFTNNNNNDSFMINSGYHSPRKYQDNQSYQHEMQGQNIYSNVQNQFT